MDAQPSNDYAQYTWSADEITRQCDEAIRRFQEAIETIVRSDPSRAFEILSRAEDDLSAVEPLCTFPRHVTTDAAVRAASTVAQKRLDAFAIDWQARADLYAKLSAHDASQLDGEDAYYWRCALRDFERNGLALEAADRERLVALKKRESALCTEMDACLSEDASELLLSAEQLRGTAPEWLAGLERAANGDGRYRVPAKLPQMVTLLEQCEVEATRLAMDQLWGNRALGNVPRFRELIALRHEMAQLLGYACYADYAIETRMAQSVSNVRALYDRLLPRLEEKARQELAELRALSGAEITTWNQRYWQSKRLAAQYAVDKQRVRQYFPLERVVRGTLELYQEVLGLAFERVEPAPALWHPSVQAYRVRDAATQALLGEFFLDLEPRVDKYGHMAEFQLRTGLRAGPRARTAVAALVGNFSKGNQSHAELTTFFHEFGHVMHELLGAARYTRLAGTNVEKDFVETPSQALENWCWDRRVLQRIGLNAAGEPLPDALIDSMLAARSADAGLFYLRQGFFGKVDLEMHSSAADPNALYDAMLPAVTLVTPSPASRLAGWGHMFGSYAAAYYGYLWAEANAADAFAHIGDCLDPQRGMAYRRAILEAGGARPAIDSLREFLGREPNLDALVRRIGLE